jgi:hypothetical protein
VRHAKSLATALLAAATLTTHTFSADATHDDPGVVSEWNALLQANIPSNAGIMTPRYYSMLHVAMFDAANAIEREYTPYHVKIAGAYSASAEAAAAQAAHDVLVALIPGAQATFDSALAARLSRLQPWRAHFGTALGRKVALRILAWRNNDGSTAPPPYVLPAIAGLWQPTPPSMAAAQGTHFGEMTPFALPSPTLYFPDRPPTLTSEEYAADFDEVKRLGSASSTERLPDQTLLARLFAPVGYRTQHWAIWNNVARDVARDRSWSLVETARLFALVNTSIHDGLQTSHSAKLVYGLWRPITAIRQASDDLNPLTAADVAWTPLITTPPYPSHPSNQTCVGVSAARALANAVGSDSVTFSATWLGNTGVADVTHNYSSFLQLARDQARSRVFAGIHFTFELTAAEEVCTKVADYVAANYALPRDRRFD